MFNRKNKKLNFKFVKLENHKFLKFQKFKTKD